jgi:RNA polymerase sigma factor (TIGR02999 family)
MHEITKLLRAWSDGDQEALNKLMPLVSDELKKIARRYMDKERRGHILQPTALVNEAWIKLMPENISWENRKQFYGFVARRMRQVLVDYVRGESATKRGQRPELVDLNEAKDKASGKSQEVLRLHEALTELAQRDARLVDVVECRFFIGLSLEETAKVVGTSTATVHRDWRFARDWLKTQMSQT